MRPSSCSDRMQQIEDLVEVGTDGASKAGLISAAEKEGEEFGTETSPVERRLYDTRSGQDRVMDRAVENLSLLQRLLPEKAGVLETLRGEVDEYTRRLAATPSIWPTRGRLTSSFGMRRNPFGGGRQFHYGVDIANSYGTPVYATASGQISQAGYRRGYGNLIIIRHGYGFSTYYAHLSRFAVSSVRWVSRGQVIGYMGRSDVLAPPSL